MNWIVGINNSGETTEDLMPHGIPARADARHPEGVGFDDSKTSHPPAPQ
jgi:hypothetical protein